MRGIMKFDSCFLGMDLEYDQKSIMDCCIQALSIEIDVFESVLDDLSDGESSGVEMAAIYLEHDRGSCPDFKGVCFNYIDEYASVSKEEANAIISRTIEVLKMDYEWKGFGEEPI